jgi:hypothetical protein
MRHGHGKRAVAAWLEAGNYGTKMQIHRELGLSAQVVCTAVDALVRDGLVCMVGQVATVMAPVYAQAPSADDADDASQTGPGPAAGATRSWEPAAAGRRDLTLRVRAWIAEGNEGSAAEIGAALVADVGCVFYALRSLSSLEQPGAVVVRRRPMESPHAKARGRTEAVWGRPAPRLTAAGVVNEALHRRSTLELAWAQLGRRAVAGEGAGVRQME